MTKHYPDNSAIYALKAEGRKQRAALTFAAKLDALDDLRQRVEPIIRAREASKAARADLRDRREK